MGEDLEYILQSLTTKSSSMAQLYLNDRIEEKEMKILNVLGTEKRTIVTEAGALEVNRQCYVANQTASWCAYKR